MAIQFDNVVGGTEFTRPQLLVGLDAGVGDYFGRRGGFGFGLGCGSGCGQCGWVQLFVLVVVQDRYARQCRFAVGTL